MKKIYETPVCQTVYTAEEDILTASFLKFEKGTEGGFDGGAVIKW